MRARPPMTRDALGGQLPVLTGPDPANRPPQEGGNATGENNLLKDAIKKAFKENKINKSRNNDDPNNPDKGPRFVLAWRMYPNANNTHIQQAISPAVAAVAAAVATAEWRTPA
jgi:hypothetical protein